ncbi:MAG: short-chain dehydrogenase/reductase [Propionibacteriales bacterium]|nr:short-chain dehydrogenase/reductase [Propionibacteriales bacterium]
MHPFVGVTGLPRLRVPPVLGGLPGVRADEPLDLVGRVALVTCAAEGIGRATAVALGARGARVVLVDVAEDLLDEATLLAGDDAHDAHAIVADVRDRVAMADAVREVRSRFGRLDVVVANAGVAPEAATLRTTDLDDFDRVVGVNLTGVMNTVHPAIDDVVATRGHVHVVSSVAAFAPGFGAASYGASKAGVEHIGRALRIELGPTGASAGVAYFGVVATSLVRRTFEEDPLGRRVETLMPAPVRRRISPEQAAASIVDGIEQRSARSIAPRLWEPYSLMREVMNRRLDEALRADARVQSVLAAVERRTRG